VTTTLGGRRDARSRPAPSPFAPAGAGAGANPSPDCPGGERQRLRRDPDPREEPPPQSPGTERADRAPCPAGRSEPASSAVDHLTPRALSAKRRPRGLLRRADAAAAHAAGAGADSGGVSAPRGPARRRARRWTHQGSAAAGASRRPPRLARPRPRGRDDLRAPRLRREGQAHARPGPRRRGRDPPHAAAAAHAPAAGRRQPRAEPGAPDGRLRARPLARALAEPSSSAKAAHALATRPTQRRGQIVFGRGRDRSTWPARRPTEHLEATAGQRRGVGLGRARGPRRPSRAAARWLDDALPRGLRGLATERLLRQPQRSPRPRRSRRRRPERRRFAAHRCRQDRRDPVGDRDPLGASPRATSARDHQADSRRARQQRRKLFFHRDRPGRALWPSDTRAQEPGLPGAADLGALPSQLHPPRAASRAEAPRPEQARRLRFRSAAAIRPAQGGSARAGQALLADVGPLRR
jgi:hypothetical protein